MGELQIIRTPNGEELVVLPRTEYEALVARVEADSKDEGDARVCDEGKAKLSARGRVLPAEVSIAMKKGDNILTALRAWRGMTQLQLSGQTGIGQGYLSDLECGRGVPTAAAVERLALALNVPPAWLG